MSMLRLYINIFGKRGILVAFLSRISKYLRRTIVVSVPVFIDKRFSVFLRLRTTDIDVFKEIFLLNSLTLELSKPPRVIIDAGAYTGLSSVFFAARYPNSTVIALEPERSNFDLLVKNSKAFTNILPINAALWTDVTELNIYDPGIGHFGFQTLPVQSLSQGMDRIPSVTIEKIMLDHNIEFVDVLKLDIEGAEKEILESSRNWIRKVGVLVVELHDRFREGCTEAFEAASSDFEYEDKRPFRVIRMRKEFVPQRLMSSPSEPLMETSES